MLNQPTAIIFKTKQTVIYTILKLHLNNRLQQILLEKLKNI